MPSIETAARDEAANIITKFPGLASLVPLEVLSEVLQLAFVRGATYGLDRNQEISDQARLFFSRPVGGVQ
jgi:hypothetical protein